MAESTKYVNPFERRYLQSLGGETCPCGCGMSADSLLIIGAHREAQRASNELRLMGWSQADQEDTWERHAREVERVSTLPPPFPSPNQGSSKEYEKEEQSEEEEMDLYTIQLMGLSQ